MASLPTDPLFQQQWYLYNTGDNSGGTAGVDLNLIDEDENNFDVWDDYTGKDIAIGIVDDGVESEHEDLAANYNSTPEGLDPAYDPAEGTPVEGSDAQGTKIAGIIAGVANNDLGIVGVAYDAKVTGFLDDNVTDTDASLLSRQAAFDISNNSWGSSNPFSTNFNLEADGLAEEAIKVAVTEGRDGKGTVFLWAAENERQQAVNSNYGNYENSRYTIAVATVDANGVFAPFSKPGANLLVSAFGGESASIVTSDRTGVDGDNPPAEANPLELEDPNYTNQFGISSATPMVSGVVALMLEANPELGYRDVQEILAYSAAQTDAENEEWTFNAATNWNGGGLHVNHNYGFGLVDAHAAVRLAESWGAQSTAANEIMVENGPTVQQIFDIPDNDPNGLTNTLNIESGLNIDRIEADIFIEHSAIEDLLIKLTSPDGTESLLFDGPTLASMGVEIEESPDLEEEGELVPFTDFRLNPGNFTTDPEELALGESYQQGINFTFSSTRYWGEIGAGDWNLSIVDNKTGDTGTLNSWSLRLYGDEVTTDNTYIYTDEFGTLGDDSVPGNLDDTEGIDTLNAAAVTSDIVLDLTPTSDTSSIAGKTLNIGLGTIAFDAETVIENAIAGDGNDSILGNAVDNKLYGGRGDDSLDGAVGNDSLFGGSGTDILAGAAGDDVYVINAVAAAGTQIEDAEGEADSLIFSDDTVTGFSDKPNEDILISSDGLAEGSTGFAQDGSNLIIDLNRDGVAAAADDLTIVNFFSEEGEAGTGFIETVGNLSGMDILNQQTPGAELSIEDISLAEGNDSLTDFTFTVKLSEASDESVTVQYATESDAAEEEADFQATSGELTFEAGETEKTIVVSVVGDTELEEDEAFFVKLSEASGATIATEQAIGTIENDDAIAGTPGDDSLEGNDGGDDDISDDIFEGSTGNDFIKGGLGFNKVVYIDFTFSVVINLVTGIVIKGSGGTDTLDGIQSVEGSNQGDSISGGDNEEELNGGDGNDVLDGGAGNDTIDGGMPSEGVDNDTLTAGTGNDVVMGCNGGDSIDGGDGVDKLSYLNIVTGVSIDLTLGIAIVGGATDNFIDIEYVEGSNQDDTLTGGIGNDTLAGGAGNDSYEVDTPTGGTAIEDTSGSADVLTLGFSFSLTILTIGLIGVGRLGTKLILDINKDGQIVEADDLTILDFFSESGEAGAGFIETVGSFQGSAILEFLSAAPTPSPSPEPTPSPSPEPTPSPSPEPTPSPSPEPSPSPTPSGGGTGTDGNDSLEGGAGDETLTGGAGNDSLDGGAGNDLVDGGDSDDDLSGGTGNDTSIGNAGDDTLAGDDGSDSLDGGAGNDLVGGGDGDDICSGGAGNDSLGGGEGNDLVDGGDGDDICSGGAEDDSLGGGAGNDLVDGGDGNDSIDGGADGDTCNGGTGSDTIVGNDGSDWAIGNEGTDSLNGDEGNDSLYGNQDGDTLDGGTGNDLCHGGTEDDVVDGGSGEDTVAGDMGNDTVTGGDGSDTASGNQGDDSIAGGMGNDTCHGGKDNDTVKGNQGNDFVAGDLGNDTVKGGEDDDYVNGNQDDDDVEGGNGNDTCHGGKGNDAVKGNGGNDTVMGDLGKDTVTGGEDDDYLNGNQDDDDVEGGKGKDICHGGQGNDAVDGNQGSDSLMGDLGSDSVSGGKDSDYVNGNQGDDDIAGGDGNDVCHGGQDNDNIDGNDGDDSLMGDRGNDNVNGGEGNNTLYGNQGDDNLCGGSGNEALYGGKENDILCGAGGDDAVSGDIGDDTLIGVDTANANPGTGEVDSFCGGVGVDDFILGDSNAIYYNGDGAAGVAVITDFNLNEDKIQLKGSSASYLLSVSVSSEIEIYLKGANSEPGDLIAKVQTSASLSIEASYFRFI